MGHAVRVLVVEDKVKLATILGRGLRKEGLSADICTTGEDAIWMAGSTPYDAVILDVMLPGRDGLSVVQELRALGNAVPVLALTARGTLEDRPRMAKKFYGVVSAAMLIGLALDYIGIDAVRMLFWSAVLNGVLAPPLIALVVLITSSKNIMGERRNSLLLKILGWATAVIMAAAAIGMFVTMS